MKYRHARLVVVFLMAGWLLAGCASNDQSPAEAARWRTEGKLYYSTDYAPNAGTKCYPYILGGTDVRVPSEAAMQAYRKAGYLQDMSLDQLKKLYWEEGITWTIQDEGGIPRKHVLEGGTSLLAPLPGTTGFTRLFGQLHPPYKPKGEQTKLWAARVQAQAQALAAGTTVGADAAPAAAQTTSKTATAPAAAASSAATPGSAMSNQ